MTAKTTPAETALLDIDKLKNINVIDELTKFDSVLMTMGIEWGMRLLAAIVILTAGWVIGNWVDRIFNRMHRLDNTLKNFLGGFFKYTIIFLSFITVIGLFGIPMASLLAVLGAAGLAIGLALQGTLANIASGVMLLILRPFNVGDYITWGDQGGTVKSLGLFGTELATSDNVYVFAPNSKIWGNEIRNFSRNTLRNQDIRVAVGYDDDLAKVYEIILGVLAKDERVITDEDRKPKVLTDKMNDYTVDLIVRFWSSNADYWSLRWDLTRAIKTELEKAGVNLAVTTRQLAIQSGASEAAER